MAISLYLNYSRVSPESCNEYGGIDFKNGGEREQIEYRKVPFPTLNRADIGAVKATEVSKGFL